MVPPDASAPTLHSEDQTPTVIPENPIYTISDGKGDSNTTLSMVSVNSSTGDVSAGGQRGSTGGAGVAGKEKIDDADAEKQPLSGVKDEKWYSTLVQVAIPFFIAGGGTIGAGLVLGKVKDWPVFVNVSAIFVLVPALAGLKGKVAVAANLPTDTANFTTWGEAQCQLRGGQWCNLDMCLASRLSTQANLGNMDSAREIVSMVIGNVSLVQVQAIVAATIVALFAVVANSVTDRTVSGDNILLLVSSAIFTATTTCFVLDFVMVVVIVGSHRFKLNPDNLATPLAASIGDVVTNTILSLTAQYMYDTIQISIWQPITLICLYMCMLPVWVYIVFKNKYTKKVLTSGWTPVISALFISGAGGIVLDQAIDQFTGYEVFQPIVNGIGGNLVSVQCSRISTHLHQSAIPGELPENTRILEWPWKTLFFGTKAAKVARMLIVLGVLGQIVFMVIADFVYMGKVTIQVTFGITYLLCSTMQVMVLLYCAYVLVNFMWTRKKDPDNAAIPYLTALGDLLGSVFLGIAFFTLAAIGQGYGDNNGSG